MPARYQDILNFWFADMDSQGNVPSETSMRWYKKDDRLDQYIREHFLADLEAAMRGEYNDWLDQANSRLALIILLDQFSRNLFRNDPRSFTQDEQALQIAIDGLAAKHDQQLLPVERSFFYMPFEHAEDRGMQAQSVELFKQLHAEASEQYKQSFEHSYDYALKHKVIVDRFGRFPHRNKILARQSTDEELQFLTEPNSSF